MIRRVLRCLNCTIFAARVGTIFMALVIVLKLAFHVLLGLPWQDPINRRHDSMRPAAECQLRAVVHSLDRYAADHQGWIPTTEMGLMALIERPEGDADWKGPYFEFSAPVIPQDPWGSEVRYEVVPVDNGRPRARVWSLGPDRQPDTSDEIFPQAPPSGLAKWWKANGG